uniref:Uncharacterized protein n=1 Tax=Cacopsylla melanoneura TaxID=428564 RepID=A0A8D9E6Q4_9HEMI
MDQWFHATIFVVITSLCFHDINSVTVLHQFPRTTGFHNNCLVDNVGPLNHMTIGKNGQVFIAGVNRLIQLNSNLEVEECVATGKRCKLFTCFRPKFNSLKYDRK